jgi:hypothetical protein
MRPQSPRPRRQLVDLQDRRTELNELLDSPQPGAPTAEELAQARKHIRGDDKHRKHLLQAIIAEIRVRITRTHHTRVPLLHAQQADTVRASETLVGAAGVEPATSRL